MSDDDKYVRFDLPKKGGGARSIAAPIPRIRTLQRRLLAVLEEVYSAKPSAHGFVKNRSICTNARDHVRKRSVLNFDLENFFPTIHFGRVRGMFLARPYNCTSEVATVLAQLCCYKGYLPQGAPTSPIVSNMVCSRLDSHLRTLAVIHHCQYSRYADDITFSSSRYRFPRALAKRVEIKGKLVCRLGKSVIGTIVNNGFKINDAKTRLQLQNERQVVTGLVTNKKLNLPRKYIRDVRAMLNNWRTKGLNICQTAYEGKYRNTVLHKPGTKPLFKEFVRGKIDYIGSVRGRDDSIYLKLLQELADLEPALLSYRVHERLRKLNDRFAFILDLLVVIDSTKWDDSDCLQGTGFHLEGYGVITCEHTVPDESLYEIYHRGDVKKQYGKIDARNQALDLARVWIKDLPLPPFEKSEILPVQGDAIWLAGFPNYGPGSTGIVEPGIITGNRIDENGNTRYLISAAIREGNSGGPVFDKDLRVIGVAAKGINQSSSSVHANFFEVIPIDLVDRL